LFDIGGSLAAARKGQGLTPSDAERLTCLRGKYIAALEGDDFDALPGRTYARAFLRSYADALGLDADSFVAEFDERYPEPEEDDEPAPVIQVRRRRRMHPRLVFALTVLAALVGIAVWGSTGNREALTPVAAPPAAQGAVVLHTHSHARAAVHKAAPVQHPQLVISATGGECWLLVRRGGAGGAVLFQGILAQGKTLRFSPRVWVRFGAPWNVKVHRGTTVPAGLQTTAPVNLSL